MNFLMVLVFVSSVHGASLRSEPQCSKFHYEEQLLEKMIRMEIKVEDMERRFLETDKNVHDVLENLKTEKTNMQKGYSQFEKRYTKDREERTTEIEKLKGTLFIERVAFKARGPADKSLETGQIIVFTETMFEESNGYDNMTGIFTAAMGGTYLFTIHMCLKNQKSLYYGIMVDNTIQTAGEFYENKAHHCYTANAIVVLYGGEKVYVKCLRSSSGEILLQKQNYMSTFSGVLIHK